MCVCYTPRLDADILGQMNENIGLLTTILPTHTIFPVGLPVGCLHGDQFVSFLTSNQYSEHLLFEDFAAIEYGSIRTQEYGEWYTSHKT